MSTEKDRLRPPKAGEPISSAYLKQEHRRNRRNAIVPVPPLWGRQTAAGYLIGLGATTGGGAVELALTGEDGVPARSGTVLGYANVTLKGLGNAIITPGSGQTVTAFNLSTVPVAANAYVLLATVEGHRVVIYEDCPDA